MVLLPWIGPSSSLARDQPYKLCVPARRNCWQLCSLVWTHSGISPPSCWWRRIDVNFFRSPPINIEDIGYIHFCMRVCDFKNLQDVSVSSALTYVNTNCCLLQTQTYIATTSTGQLFRLTLTSSGSKIHLNSHLFSHPSPLYRRT